MGFFSQCEKKHNYFVRPYKVTSAASICMNHRTVSDQHVCVCNNLISHEWSGVTHEWCNGCVCMHWYSHFAFKELIQKLPDISLANMHQLTNLPIFC